MGWLPMMTRQALFSICSIFAFTHISHFTNKKQNQPTTPHRKPSQWATQRHQWRQRRTHSPWKQPQIKPVLFLLLLSKWVVPAQWVHLRDGAGTGGTCVAFLPGLRPLSFDTPHFFVGVENYHKIAPRAPLCSILSKPLVYPVHLLHTTSVGGCIRSVRWRCKLVLRLH